MRPVINNDISEGIGRGTHIIKEFFLFKNTANNWEARCLIHFAGIPEVIRDYRNANDMDLNITYC